MGTPPRKEGAGADVSLQPGRFPLSPGASRQRIMGSGSRGGNVDRLCAGGPSGASIPQTDDPWRERIHLPGISRIQSVRAGALRELSVSTEGQPPSRAARARAFVQHGGASAPLDRGVERLMNVRWATLPSIPMRMKPKYCYWSVCDGIYGAMMEHCVDTARSAGVFKEFHVFTDRPLEGCQCYDAYQFEKTNGLFKLHYLKVGMSRLNFDYFIWLDADTVFVRNPLDPLEALGRSPIHVPLETDISTLTEGNTWNDVSLVRLRDMFRQEGVMNQP